MVFVTCSKAWTVLLLTCSVQLFIWITYTTEQEEEMEVNNNKQVSESRDASVCKHQEIIQDNTTDPHEMNFTAKLRENVFILAEKNINTCPVEFVTWIRKFYNKFLL